MPNRPPSRTLLIDDTVSLLIGSAVKMPPPWSFGIWRSPNPFSPWLRSSIVNEPSLGSSTKVMKPGVSHVSISEKRLLLMFWNCGATRSSNTSIETRRSKCLVVMVAPITEGGGTSSTTPVIRASTVS